MQGAMQCRRLGFDPWVGKIPGRRAWQPTPVFLPGESHGQRSVVNYSPRGHKESHTAARLSTHMPYRSLPETKRDGECCNKVSQTHLQFARLFLDCKVHESSSCHSLAQCGVPVTRTVLGTCRALSLGWVNTMGLSNEKWKICSHLKNGNQQVSLHCLNSKYSDSGIG